MSDQGIGKTTLGIVSEVGDFGSLNIKDPTVTEVNQMEELYKKTNDPHLKQYLRQQMGK